MSGNVDSSLSIGSNPKTTSDKYKFYGTKKTRKEKGFERNWDALAFYKTYLRYRRFLYWKNFKKYLQRENGAKCNTTDADKNSQKKNTDEILDFKK